MNFDTGSSIFWVYSAKCDQLSEACRKSRRYDSSKSRTYKQYGGSFHIKYEKGSADGFYLKDILRMGGLRAAMQIVGEAVNSTTFDDAKWDGIFGLGFPSSKQQFLSPLDNFLNDGFIKERHFSFKLNSAGSGAIGGELIIGGVDKAHFTGKMYFFPVTRARHWQLRMESVAIQKTGVTLCVGGCDVILDTGSSLILGPYADIEKLNVEILKAKLNERHKRYYLHCSTVNDLPVIQFVLKNKANHIKKYSLKPKQYIRRFKVCALSLNIALQFSHWPKY